jgi:hypothetical protein
MYLELLKKLNEQDDLFQPMPEEEVAVQRQKSLKPDYEKVFENDKVIAVKINNYGAWRKYARNARWCQDEVSFENIYTGGQIYIIIVKGTSDIEKYIVWAKEEGIEVWNNLDYRVKDDDEFFREFRLFRSVFEAVDDMFQPASEEELIARPKKEVDAMWKNHNGVLNRGPKAIKAFIDEINGQDSVVKLVIKEAFIYDFGAKSRLSQQLTASFEVVLDIAIDKYIDTSAYTLGGSSGFIYLSDKFYADVDKSAENHIKVLSEEGKDEKVEWNNTKTSGWIHVWLRETVPEEQTIGLKRKKQ